MNLTKSRTLSVLLFILFLNLAFTSPQQRIFPLNTSENRQVQRLIDNGVDDKNVVKSTPENEGFTK